MITVGDVLYSFFLYVLKKLLQPFPWLIAMYFVLIWSEPFPEFHINTGSGMVATFLLGITVFLSGWQSCLAWQRLFKTP